jgi:hypothetical protein
MLGGMARRRPGPQRHPRPGPPRPRPPGPVTEGPASGCGRENVRAVAGGQLPGSGQEVGVQVRVSGERDRQPAPPGGRPQIPQISRRIHRQRLPISQTHQVGRIPQPSSTTGTISVPPPLTPPSAGGHRYRQAGPLPLREAVDEAPGAEAVAVQFAHRLWPRAEAPPARGCETPLAGPVLRTG